MTFTTELKRIKKVILAAVLTPEESMDSTRMNSETTGNTMRAAGPTGANNRASGNAAGALAPEQLSGTPASHNMDALLKRLMKFKHLEEDNKKLKNLLK